MPPLNPDHIAPLGTAPRVTSDAILSAIRSVRYFTGLQGARMAVLDDVANGTASGQPVALEPVLGQLTFCILVLVNGFTVVGHSACVSAANFDAQKGREIAYAHALDQCWPLFGFSLADRLYLGLRAHETAESTAPVPPGFSGPVTPTLPKDEPSAYQREELP